MRAQLRVTQACDLVENDRRRVLGRARWPMLYTAPPVVAGGRKSGGQQAGQAATSSGCSGAAALTARSVIQYMLPNPKVPGSSAHARYDKYCIATTLAEARALGALSKDIQFDRQKGYIHEEKKVPQRRLSSKQRA